jgi:hypothetical protein
MRWIKLRAADFPLVAAGFQLVSKCNGRAPSANLLHGLANNARSVTITPTWQCKFSFVQPEVSYVAASKMTPGSVLGRLVNSNAQMQEFLERGILFWRWLETGIREPDHHTARWHHATAK